MQAHDSQDWRLDPVSLRPRHSPNFQSSAQRDWFQTAHRSHVAKCTKCSPLLHFLTDLYQTRKSRKRIYCSKRPREPIIHARCNLSSQRSGTFSTHCTSTHEAVSYLDPFASNLETLGGKLIAQTTSMTPRSSDNRQNSRSKLKPR